MSNTEHWLMCRECGCEAVEYKYEPTTDEIWILCDSCGCFAEGHIDWGRSASRNRFFWKNARAAPVAELETAGAQFKGNACMLPFCSDSRPRKR